jgi:hypothetical protein
VLIASNRPVTEAGLSNEEAKVEVPVVHTKLKLAGAYQRYWGKLLKIYDSTP